MTFSDRFEAPLLHHGGSLASPLEFDPPDRIFFGLVVGFDTELGYFALEDLENTRGPLGLPIERDLHFEPAALSTVRRVFRTE